MNNRIVFHGLQIEVVHLLIEGVQVVHLFLGSATVVSQLLFQDGSRLRIVDQIGRDDWRIDWQEENHRRVVSMVFRFSIETNLSLIKRINNRVRLGLSIVFLLPIDYEHRKRGNTNNPKKDYSHHQHHYREDSDRYCFCE
jgi:hypothetical protein